MRMVRTWSIFMVVIAAAALLLGCPKPPSYSPAFIVSTANLDFGVEKTSMTFTISNVWTTRPMPQFTVTSNQAWLSLNPTTGTSSGPSDPVTITATVDRSKMTAGSNTAVISITAPGVPKKTITATATAILVADFRTDVTLPFLGQPVVFTDRSSVSAGYGPIVSWEWDFGDGSTSTQQHPVHTYAATGSYSIRLTVRTAGRTSTVFRENYITVQEKTPPTADFDVSNRTPLALREEVQFYDLTQPGTAPLSSWLWDFGDGNTSADQNPKHIYTIRATYIVHLDIMLEVTSAHGTDDELKLGYIALQPAPPDADFTAQTTTPTVNNPVQFFDQSSAGSADITSWLWDFGDGNTSNVQNPTHTYTQIQPYTVKLTVTTALGSNTETKTNYINVGANPPTAEFSASNLNPEVNEPVQFTDLSDPGTAPAVTSWLWNFGDGGTSTDQNPTHAYPPVSAWAKNLTGMTSKQLRRAARAYAYTVSLTVGTEYGQDTETKVDYISVQDGGGLDNYLTKANPHYATQTRTGFPKDINVPLLGTARVWVVKLTSQQWMADHVTDPDDGIWYHWLTIATPTSKTLDDTALLWIDGGDNGDSPPNTTELTELASIALLADSTLAQVSQVPNQPLTFDWDVVSPPIAREEDQIVAYTFRRFIDEYGDPGADEWPAYLPMVKSAVTAMDAVQEYVPSIEQFVVTGASKRGWTAWLTAATDPKQRVAGVMPMVIDLLNMPDSFIHHYRAYGEYSEAIRDYDAPDGGYPYGMDVVKYVVDTTPTQATQALLEIVDPYSYTARLTMPKLGINATGDEFFLPDSAQFYFDDLLGSKYLNYVPNVGHSLGGYDAAIAAAVPFYNGVAKEEDIPALTWDTSTDGVGGLNIDVTTDDTVTPTAVTLYTATTAAGQRNFSHLLGSPPVWSATPLSDPNGDGVYEASVADPGSNRWTGFFVQVVYPSGVSGSPYTFTTQVYVVPDTLPYPAP